MSPELIKLHLSCIHWCDQSAQTYLICIQEYHKNSLRSQSTLGSHYTLPTQSSATNQALVELTLINDDIGTKWILTVWGEIGQSGSCQESNPNTWLVQPVVCHWAVTTRQPPTLTIFYMYCTGHTPGSHWVSAVRTSLEVDWKFYSVYFSLFNWENHSAWAFCWWREFSSQTLTGNILLPPVQYIRVEECENWRLSGCCSLVAEHRLHAQCPRFNCWWLPTFHFPLISPQEHLYSQREARVLSSWSWDFTILSISWWRWVQSDCNQDLFLLCESLSAALTTCTFPHHLPQ